MTQNLRPADPITAVIAGRLPELRKKSGLNQTELAERMTERGSPWSRTTVQKLEAGTRAGVTVQELLALALVFDLPPVMLLADPRVSSNVPITQHQTLDSWTALGWMAGLGNGAGPRLVEAGLRVANAMEVLREPSATYFLHQSADKRGVEPSSAAIDRARESEDFRHRQALLDIRSALTLIRREGAAIPASLDRQFILRRASELDVLNEYGLDQVLSDGRDDEEV